MVLRATDPVEWTILSVLLGLMFKNSLQAFNTSHVRKGSAEQVMGQRPCPCHIELPWCKQRGSMPESSVILLPGSPEPHAGYPLSMCTGRRAEAQAGCAILGTWAAAHVLGLLCPLIKGRTMRLNRSWSSKNLVVTSHSDLWSPLKYPGLGGQKPSVSFWRQCCGQGLLVLYCQVVT